MAVALRTSEGQYLDLLREILEDGVQKGDRTGTGTLSVFGRQMRFDLAEGFPLLTTKRVFLRGIIHELLWFLAGESNIKPLVDANVHIWDDWPYRHYKEVTGDASLDQQSFIAKIKDDAAFAAQWGDLGPVYGVQWRRWPNPDGTTTDQIANAIEMIRTNPDSRRIIVSAWNPAEIEEMAKAGLPPCHTLFQFYVHDGKLSLQLYQRSADVFLGVPFNIASYALLLMMVAQVTGLQAGEFVHTLGDAHLYLNHLDQAREQLTREPRVLPQMRINSAVREIDGFTVGDFELAGYEPWPAIKAPIAV